MDATFAPLTDEKIEVIDLADVLGFFTGQTVEVAGDYEKEDTTNGDIIIPAEKASLKNWGSRPVPESLLKIQEEEKATQLKDLAKFDEDFPKELKKMSEQLAHEFLQIQKRWGAWKIAAGKIAEITGLEYKTVSCKGKKNHSPNGCRFAHGPSSGDDLQKIFSSWKKVAGEIMKAYNIATDKKNSVAVRHEASNEATMKLKGLYDRIKGLNSIIHLETDSMIFELRTLEQNAKLYSEKCTDGLKCTRTGCTYAPVAELVRPVIPAKNEKGEIIKNKKGNPVLLYAHPGTVLASCYHGSRCESVIKSGRCGHLHKKEHITKDAKNTKSNKGETSDE